MNTGWCPRRCAEFQGRLALGRSDVQRQTDRVAWAEAMAGKGYLAQSQLLSERQALATARHELAKTEGEFRLFRRFEVPKEIQSLRGQIETAEINQRVGVDRLKAELDRLAMIRKQVENCVIRAPQDGVVVYANGNRWRSRPLEPGVRVYQDQSMFVLPDLSQMEVEISVNESVGPRVRVGMRANVRLASMADRVLPGRVVSMDMLSTQNWREWDDRLRHFVARVRLDKTPAERIAVHVGLGGDRHRRSQGRAGHPRRVPGRGGRQAVLLRRRARRPREASHHDPPRDDRPARSHRGAGGRGARGLAVGRGGPEVRKGEARRFLSGAGSPGRRFTETGKCAYAIEAPGVTAWAVPARASRWRCTIPGGRAAARDAKPFAGPRRSAVGLARKGSTRPTRVHMHSLSGSGHGIQGTGGRASASAAAAQPLAATEMNWSLP